MTHAPEPAGPGARRPRLSQDDRYLLGLGIGIVLILVGTLLAWNDKESLGMTATGAVLMVLGIVGTSLRRFKLGKEGAELEFEQVKQEATAAALDSAARQPVPLPSGSGVATGDEEARGARSVRRTEPAYTGQVLAQAAAAIRSGSPAELGANLAELGRATANVLWYSYDELEPGVIENVRVWAPDPAGTIRPSRDS